MDTERRITAFVRLGEALRRCEEGEGSFGAGPEEKEAFDRLLETALQLERYNGWFIPPFVFHALKSLGESLREEKVLRWISHYENRALNPQSPVTVGVVMAGNIPAVGFHDFLTVLMSGNRILAKLSSDDNKLLPAIARLLTAIEPDFKSRINFTDGHLKNFDAIIATGSNNTARYFEYYFGKYPHIIRKNRNGTAVLTGKENEDQLKGLRDDIFLYYGLGCRNISTIFVPHNYDFTPLLDVLSKEKEIAENHKYFNNYEYNKAVFLINGKAHFDTGNLLLTEDDRFASPVSVVHYQYYDTPETLNNILTINKDKIQCITGSKDLVAGALPLGTAQHPELWDYADGVDTMQFISELAK